MTTSVADKTPISAKVWRRHTDPPSLWIFVAISSVSLHVLAFWFMRSSNAFRPWFPQQSQTTVPIEFVEISPQAKPKSTVKKVTPKPPVSSQQTVSSRLPQKAQATPKNQNTDAISSENAILDSSKTEVSQTNTQLSTKKIVSTPTPTPTSKPTPTPIPTVPVGDLPWNRRQQIELGKGKLLPTDIPSVPLEQPRGSETEQEQTPRIPGEEDTSTATGETPRIPGEEATSTATGETPRIPGEEATSTATGETPRIPGEEATSTATGETPRIPGEEATSTATGETPRIPGEEATSTATGETPRIPGEEATSTATGETSRIPGEEATSTATGETSRILRQGGAIAIATPLSKNEVLQLIQEGRLGQNDLPDVLAQYQGSNTKTLDSSFLPGDSEIQPAQLLTSLVIDKNGKFQQAVVIEIEPVKLQSEKILYEKVINELFSNENFLPAHNQDGAKPELSNLFVKVTVKPVSSN
jgi:hypothetical protein